MIFIAGISIGLFIVALLLSKPEKSSADYFLMIWMLLNAVHLSFFYLEYTDTLYDYPILLGFQFPLPLLHGVLLYYYVSSVTDQFPKRSYVAFLHLVPTIVTIVYLVHFFVLPSERKIEIFKGGGEEYKLFQSIIKYAVFISGLAYVFMSIRLLNVHKKRIKNQFSDIEMISLNWLRFLIYGLGLIWTLIIISQNVTLIFISVSVFVILVGYFGVQQKNIFDNLRSPYLKEKKTKEKYYKSGLTADKEIQSIKKLKALIEREKVYTNPELSLKDLASSIGIHPNYLSQIINEKEEKTFYDFINTYRVEEFKRLVSDASNRQFTLISIAYDCGFNSKSTFNRYFKKITGLTPSQYIKSLDS